MKSLAEVCRERGEARGAAKRFRKIHSVKEYTGFHRGGTQWRVVERSGDKRSERERAIGQEKDRERERDREKRRCGESLRRRSLPRVRASSDKASSMRPTDRPTVRTPERYDASRSSTIDRQARLNLELSSCAPRFCLCLIFRMGIYTRGRFICVAAKFLSCIFTIPRRKIIIQQRYVTLKLI